MMKNTWVLCMTEHDAKVFRQDSLDSTLKLCYELHDPKKKQSFARYVADEMELACGYGTTGSLVVCAEPKIPQKYCRV